jgi:hypothetical protein
MAAGFSDKFSGSHLFPELLAPLYVFAAATIRSPRIQSKPPDWKDRS